MDQAFQYLETVKIEKEDDYPYKAKKHLTCKYKANKGAVQLSGF